MLHSYCKHIKRKLGARRLGVCVIGGVWARKRKTETERARYRERECESKSKSKRERESEREHERERERESERARERQREMKEGGRQRDRGKCRSATRHAGLPSLGIPRSWGFGLLGPKAVQNSHFLNWDIYVRMHYERALALHPPLHLPPTFPVPVGLWLYRF